MEVKVPTKSERLQIDLPSNDRALPSRNRRLFKVLGITGSVILVLLGIFAWIQLYLKTGSQRDLPKTIVTRGRFEDVVTVTGRIEPRNTWDVAAPTGGRVQTVAVKPGDSVPRGGRNAEYRCRGDLRDSRAGCLWLGNDRPRVAELDALH